jgi:hypothetical protein
VDVGDLLVPGLFILAVAAIAMLGLQRRDLRPERRWNGAADIAAARRAADDLAEVSAG